MSDRPARPPSYPAGGHSLGSPARASFARVYASAGRLPAWLLIALLGVYQRTLSLFFGRVCRFEPSCSRYAIACVERFGVARGRLLSLVRVCKCHPFHPGGYDPPPARALETAAREAP